MMIITSLSQDIEMIVDVNNISIKRKSGGEQTLQFNALNTNINGPGYTLVQDDSMVEGNGERFIIKNIVENPYSKNVIAINAFFDTVNDFVIETLPDGLYDINRVLQLAFSTSDWGYILQDSYPQQMNVTDFGNDNLVSLLNKIVDAFNSEYEIDTPNKRIMIKRRIGVDTDYQIRYKSNIQNISREINSENVKTQVQVFYNLDEFGNYNSSITYNSPNIDKYPRPKVMKPIYSDVITTEGQAIEAARLALKDSPDITISVDFLSLQQLGYTGDEIQLGNGVYLIDERLNIDSLARITEIEEFYKIERGELVKDNSRPDIVTISNIRKNIVNNIIEQQQQQASIERTAVKQRVLYNGCNISPEEGFTTTATNGVKTYQNSTEGFRITVDGVNQFFVDPIARQLTLDGRLYITSNQSPLFDAFLNNAGGVMRIYDIDQNLNVEIGSNRLDTNYNGGTLAIYSDGSEITDRRVELSIRRDSDSGVINVGAPNNRSKVNIMAVNDFTGDARIQLNGNDITQTANLSPTDLQFINNNVSISVMTRFQQIQADIEDLYRRVNDLS